MRTKLLIIANAIVLLSLLAVLIFKIKYVDYFVFRHTGERFFGGINVLINDAIICSSIIALFCLSYCHKTPHILSILLRSIAFILLMVYVVDYYLITNFDTHLVVTDVLKYASYSLKYLQQIYSGMLILLLAFSTISFTVFVSFSRYKIERKSIIRLLSILSLALMLISTFSFSTNDKYVHSWIYRNIISNNLILLSEAKEYSNEFIGNFSYNEKLDCHTSTPENPNIILLMFESLSSYQSDYFSGIKNWTPNLDIIAKKNLAYKNFYANGFTTEDAEISLLTGKLPIFEPSSYSSGGSCSFNGFFKIKESLPNILKRQGYSTEFLTTADLKFSKTGEWARSIGFDYIEGHEHPYYNGWDRFHFKAAPDEALYHRVIARISLNNKNKYFIFIKTASTHHPFINPETKNKSEAEAFQYADKKLGIFYKKLSNMGFFENGMLIIVGDHHAMIPLKKKEIDTYTSLKASAKVPMIISYGDKSHYLDNNQYQHIDVFNSLKGLVSGTHYHSSWIGDILYRKAAKFIAYRRGDKRNMVSIFSGKKIALVMLDGDDTRIKSKYPETMRIRNIIINKINSIRIKRKKY